MDQTVDRTVDRMLHRFRDLVRDVVRRNGGEEFRSVAIVVAILGTLGVLSFIMAGVVGA